jgi:hypothetical protein
VILAGPTTEVLWQGWWTDDRLEGRDWVFEMDKFAFPRRCGGAGGVVLRLDRIGIQIGAVPAGSG